MIAGVTHQPVSVPQLADAASSRVLRTVANFHDEDLQGADSCGEATNGGATFCIGAGGL